MARNVLNNDDNKSYIYHLVWLDENIENNVNQQKLKQLHELDDQMKAFTNKKQCIDYIRKQNDRNTKSYIIFIVSGTLSKEVISEIHDCICILAIFIFHTKSEQISQLKLPKIRAICTNTDELIARIRNCMHRDMSSMDFSLLNNQNIPDSETKTSKEKYPIRNLKEDQARFLWFYKCHNFMLELEDDDQEAKEEMISYCRKTYHDDIRGLKIIDRFENESIDENAKNAVLWYTQNSIIFRCINKALASGNISIIYSYRYFIKLLCKQLKDLHKNSEQIQLHLYRGQLLKLSEILLISKHINDLISFNGFISTSLEKDIAKRFCFNDQIEDYEPVLFQINIDTSCKHSIAFADIRRLSQFPEEEEILLSIGSVFRIESVNFDEENQLYRINLLLTQHEQLTVNQYIEQTFAKDIDSNDQSILFGKLLFEMGEYEFAIKYYKNRIEYLTDKTNHYRATYLNNIGVCFNEIGEKDEAFKYYKIASKSYEQTNNHRGLGACYHNIASYFYYQRDYEMALEWTLKALKERQEYPLEKASTLDLLGCIQLSKRNLEAASDNLQEALKIRVKYLNNINPNHPDIGISYQNLGRLDTKLLSYIDAQNNYLRAEQIFRYNYPESHFLVREIRQCLEDIKQRLSVQ